MIGGHTMELKRCSECGRMLPISKFNKNRNSRDGLQDRCRDCFSAYNRRRYQEKKDMHDGGKTMAESPHMIACFLDGKWTDTVPADKVAAALGMSERKILRYASTTKPIPRTGISLVDLTDFPRSTCPGCFMQCHRPWPCHKSLRMPEGKGKNGR